MSIRFKFRSSVNFDSIEIDGGKPYISVGELRSKILRQKKLNGICHKDFDLVFFDDLTGQEYNDDEFEVPSGSSVIIKRVPAEPVPTTVLRHHKVEASEDIPKGMDLNKPEEIVLAPEDLEHIKLEKVANAKNIDLEKVDLPSELRCPICNAYFKEAVMIPCCQYSFCQNCISKVLPLTEKCLKCCSNKYRVEHLLPNLSLRHAIEHFLESQILATAPETDLQKYVPDGESGIQGKEVSSITKRKLDLLYPKSKSKLSNQNTAESVYERKNVFLEGTGINTSAMDQSYAGDNRNNKVRTCYMCNSPTHFIRDCPMASTKQQPMFHTDHMFQGGYATPYWNNAPYPYMNIYGMMPFSPNMLPYGIPPFAPSAYATLPLHSGGNKMVGPARFEQPFRHSENLDLQSSDNRIKYSHEKRHRSSDYEGVGNSEESHGRKYNKHSDQKVKSGHNRRYEKHSHSTNDRSVSGVEEDVHSGNYRYSEVRYKKHHEKHHNSKTVIVAVAILKENIDRWKMVDESDDDYHHNKRKRVQH